MIPRRFTNEPRERTLFTWSFQPMNLLQLLLDNFEFSIPGHQLGVARLSQSCGECIRQADRVSCFKWCRDVGEVASHRMKIDRQSDQAFRYCLPSRQTISTNDDVLHFGVIDFRHVQW